MTEFFFVRPKMSRMCLSFCSVGKMTKTSFSGTVERATDLCWSATVETGGGEEGCGVPQNGTSRDTVHLHRRPPPASTGYRRPPPASTGSCSSSLHRALLHRLLFNHPSTGTPPPSTVHPALHTTGSCSSRGNATAHYSSNPPLQRSLFIPEAPSIGFS